MVLNKNIVTVFILLFLNSCVKTELTPTEYIEWIENEENGLNTSKSFDDISFHLLFKPVDYIIAKELLNKGIKKEDVFKRSKELGDMQYFTLRIKSLKSNELLKAGIKSENEYYQRLEYFMGYMQNDLYLIEGKDTIPCGMNHFERNYGLAPYNNFIIAFSKTINSNEDKIFVYDDKVLGTGKVMMKIEAKDINNIPSIKWN